MARSVIVSADGSVRAPADLSHDEASAALVGLVDEYVQHGRWRSPAVFLEAHLRRKLMQDAGAPRKAAPLQVWESMANMVVAHELGHVAASHCDRPLPATDAERWAEEFEADEIGILFLGCLMHAAHRRAQSELDHLSVKVTYTFDLVCAAILFELMGVMTQLAKQRGLKWAQSHPPGVERYRRYRTCQIREFRVPEIVFVHGAAGLDAPDNASALIREFAAPL